MDGYDNHHHHHHQRQWLCDNHHSSVSCIDDVSVCVCEANCEYWLQNINTHTLYTKGQKGMSPLSLSHLIIIIIVKIRSI